MGDEDDDENKEKNSEPENWDKKIAGVFKGGVQDIVGIGGRLAGVDAQGAIGNAQDTVNIKKIEMLEKQLKSEKEKVKDFETEVMKMNIYQERLVKNIQRLTE